MRKKMTAKIKIAQKQLEIDEATYRSILVRVTGQDSCTRCNLKQLAAVVEEMKRLGFVATSPSHGPRPNPRPSLKPLMNKVEALLTAQNLHWNYAHGMARRMFGVDQVQWLDDTDLHKLVAALQMHANRHHSEVKE